MKKINVFYGRRIGLLSVQMLFVVTLLLGTLFFPALSSAFNVTGDSNTYLRSSESTDKHKVYDFFEYLNFSVQGDKEKISFHVGGWADYDLGWKNPNDSHSKVLNDRGNLDLQYGYLSYRDNVNNTVVNLGRLMVFEGVAAEHVDGIYARTDLAKGFGLSAFGGKSVDSDVNNFHREISDSIYGAHLTQQVAGLYKIGVSALQEKKESSDYRKEEGIDVWVHPYDKVDISGRSSYNSITNGWAEHTYLLTLAPISKLRLDTTLSIINYDDYFFRASTSALRIMSGFLWDDEHVKILGESASYALSDKMQIVADFKGYAYNLAGNANYVGGVLKYAAAKSYGAGVGYHRMNGDQDRLKYSEYRIYSYKKYEKLDVTADIIDITYNRAINKVKSSLSIVASAGYELSEKWKVGADLEYSKNPDFDKDIRTMLKATYRFDAAFSGKGVKQTSGKEETK